MASDYILVGQEALLDQSEEDAFTREGQGTKATHAVLVGSLVRMGMLT